MNSLTLTPANCFCALCLLVANLYAPAAFAHTLPDAAPLPPGAKEVTLSDVKVTGSAQDAAELVTPAVTLSGTDLLVRRKGSLGETLDGMPGVASTYFGPVASRPTVRGQDGDRVRVVQNGGASMDASGLSFDHAMAIDPLVIEHIDVLRGPSALQYSGTGGAVVNVVNQRIQATPLFDAMGGVTGRAELRAGGAESERAGSVLLETGTDKFMLHVDAFDRKTGDVRVPLGLACDRSGSGVARLSSSLCNSASTARGGAVGGTLYFDRGYLGASIETHQTRYGSVAEDTVSIDMRQHRYLVQGEWRALPKAVSGLVQSVKGQWSAVQYQHTELDQNVPGTRFANAGHDLRLEARQTPTPWLGARLEGQVGLQVQGGRFSVTGEEVFAPFTRTDSRALFVLQELTGSAGKLRLGARGESVAVDSLGHPTLARFGAAQRRFNPRSVALGGSLNVGTNPDGAWALTSNLSYTERAPKDYELYANGPHLATAAYEIGNGSLNAERAGNLDVGLNWKGGPNRFEVNAYLNQFSNYISLASTGASQDAAGNAVLQAACANGNSAESACASAALPVYAYTQVRARFTGIESSGTLRVLGAQGLATANSTLDLVLKADVVRASNLSTGQALPRIAPARASATLVWAERSGNQGLGARIGVDHYAAQNRVPTGDRATAGYRFWNLSATYGTKAGATNLLWFARLDNANNQLAYSASSILTQSTPGRVPLPGRGFKVGLQATF